MCLLISTSIQDESIPRNRTNKNAHPIERLLQFLSEQQYKYETAYYALALKNIFPNLAKYFHERSESK